MIIIIISKNNCIHHYQTLMISFQWYERLVISNDMTCHMISLVEKILLKTYDIISKINNQEHHQTLMISFQIISLVKKSIKD